MIWTDSKEVGSLPAYVLVTEVVIDGWLPIGWDGPLSSGPVYAQVIVP